MAVSSLALSSFARTRSPPIVCCAHASDCLPRPPSCLLADDFFQLGWRDAGGLGRVPLPAALLGNRISAVDTHGGPLGLPPIHHHHCHVSPGLGYSFETTFQTHDACLLDGTACPDYSAIIFHHGDYECPTGSGGTDCFTERYELHPRLAPEPLALNAELNDVRARGSAPMTWYFEISLLVSRGEELPSPASVHQIINPGLKDLTKQAGLLTLVHCPSAHDSFFYYTGRMPFSGAPLARPGHGRGHQHHEPGCPAAPPVPSLSRAGTLVPSLVRHHAHIAAFQEALLLDATPDVLGLDDAGFRPEHAWKAILTADTGLADNTVLRDRVLGRAHAAGARLLCTAVGRLEEVDGLSYDRAPRVRCAAWAFRHGDAWTTLALNGPHSQRFFFHPLTIEHLAGDPYPQHLAGMGHAGIEGMAQAESQDAFDFRRMPSMESVEARPPASRPAPRWLPLPAAPDGLRSPPALPRSSLVCAQSTFSGISPTWPTTRARIGRLPRTRRRRTRPRRATTAPPSSASSSTGAPFKAASTRGSACASPPT